MTFCSLDFHGLPLDERQSLIPVFPRYASRALAHGMHESKTVLFYLTLLTWTRISTNSNTAPVAHREIHAHSAPPELLKKVHDLNSGVGMCDTSGAIGMSAGRNDEL